MESKSPAVTVASVTNASATPHYYPSAAGLPLGHAERLVLQIVCSGGVTLTFEVSDDNSTWTDVTKSLTSLNTGSTATSYVDKSDLLVFEGALFAQWRVKCVCSDATNAIQIVATTAAGVVTKSGGGGGGGTVTGVTATAPIAASAGAAPVISWAPTTDVSMSAHKITSLTAGSASTDAVNVAQLQAVTAGITTRSVRVATTVALPAYTYTNGTLGVGAKFTFTSTTSVANTYTDGVTVNVGDRILVKDETGAKRGYHGLYVVTQRGDSILATDIWTRVTDCDTAAELASLDVRVDVGTTQAGQLWCSYNDPDTFVVGSTVQIFIAAGVAAHASTHAIGASDALPAASTSVAGIVKIGTGATDACAGNDSRIGVDSSKIPLSTVTAVGDLVMASGIGAVTHLAAGVVGTMPMSNGAGALLTYESVGKYGLASAIPAASAMLAVSGATYYATDTAVLYQCVQTGASTYAWKPVPIIGQSTNWWLARDIDFTAETPGSIGADGACTIGGMANKWIKSGSALETTPLALDATYGVTIIPATGTDYFNTTNNGPSLRALLSDLLTGVDLHPDMGLRIWVINSRNNAAADFDTFVFGLDKGYGDSGWNLAGCRGSHHITGGPFLGAVDVFAGTTIDGDGGVGCQRKGLALAASNAVMCLEIPRLGGFENRVYYGTMSGAAWPAFSAMTQITNICLNPQTYPANTIAPLSSMYFSLRAVKVSSATAFVASCSRLKFEVR